MSLMGTDDAGAAERRCGRMNEYICPINLFVCERCMGCKHVKKKRRERNASLLAFLDLT